MSKGRFPAIFAIAFGAFLAIPSIQAQQADSQSTPDAQDQSAPAQDPLTRQRSDKERFKQQKELKQELHGTYKKWVDEDVHWIITDQELKAFKSLSNDEERDAFIEQFWQRRNAPGSAPNSYRAEHYRRIAYANQHFAITGLAGWETDRGRVYIVNGAPSTLESHPSFAPYGHPYETWGYAAMQFTFVDFCDCGKYQLLAQSSTSGRPPTSAAER
jgi:GWxTD domain-containing protein